MDKTKVVLDTNILISALGWEGKPKRVFDQVVDGTLELIMSREQFEELSRALDYPRLQFAQEQKERFKTLILEIATIVKPQEKITIIKEDPDDNMFLECAVAGNAKYIVSGDSDLLELKEFRGIKILSPDEFLTVTYGNRFAA